MKSTREESKKLKADLAEVGKGIIEKRGEIGNLGSGAFEEAVVDMNKYLDRCNRPLDFISDANNFQLVLKAAKPQMDVLNNDSKFNQSTATNLMAKLRESRLCKRNDDEGKLEFNWLAFGRCVGVLYRTAPGVSIAPFLDNAKKEEVVKPKKKVHFKPVDDWQSVTPEVDQSGVKHEQDPQELRIRKLRKSMKEGQELDFAQLINPNSFTQSVENILDFSFEVKHGNASLMCDKDNGNLTIQQVDGQEKNTKEDDTTNKNNQTVLSFNLQDFNEMIELYDLKGKEPMIKNREGAEYSDPLDGFDDIEPAAVADMEDDDMDIDAIMAIDIGAPAEAAVAAAVEAAAAESDMDYNDGVEESKSD